MSQMNGAFELKVVWANIGSDITSKTKITFPGVKMARFFHRQATLQIQPFKLFAVGKR